MNARHSCCFPVFSLPHITVLFMLLQCNGYDFTMVTHKKAVDYIKKHPVLNLLVARKGVTSTWWCAPHHSYHYVPATVTL